MAKSKASWIIGGTTLIGVGLFIGLFQTSVMWAIASILIGIGAGLIFAYKADKK